MRVFLKGLQGCSMRKMDVQQYEDFLKANGHEIVKYPEKSDAILLWTCAFRGDFRDNSISEIERYAQNYSGELIVVGCLPDIDQDLLKKKFQGRFINWRNDENQLEAYFGQKKKLNEIPRRLSETAYATDLDQFRKENPNQDVSFYDQFIKLFIAEGCRFHCAYCSEILAFPPYRSFPEADLIEECKKLIACTGVYQVALLADSISDYGTDIGTNLPNLIRRLCELDSRLTVALQGFNPIGFVRYLKEMLELIDEGRIRHLQLPIQSASERMLRIMNRPYTRKQIDLVFNSLNERKFSEFDTHVIIGFPTETDEDVEETAEFILEHRPKYVLASCYMESPQMPSFKLTGKIDPKTIQARLDRITKKIRGAGILCNSDGSELSVTRFQRLNYISNKGDSHDSR